LILSKLLLGLAPSLLYLRGIFGSALWDVFAGSQFRPLVAAPFCVSAVWLASLWMPQHPNWFSLVLWIGLSSVASLGFVVLFGSNREIRREICAKFRFIFIHQ
jgi:hypothetical protein